MKKNVSRILFAAALCSVFSASLLSCKNLFSHKNYDEDTASDPSIEEKIYEVSGKIFADYEDYNSSSRNAIALADVGVCNVTAREAVVDSVTGVWSEKSNGKTVTVQSSAEGAFTIKLTKGKWLLSADNATQGSTASLATPANSKVQIDLDFDNLENATEDQKKGYKSGISIKIKPVMTDGSSAGHGTVNLTITDQTENLNTLKIYSINLETNVTSLIQTISAADNHTFTFNWLDSATGNPAQKESGVYRLLFEFYTETSGTSGTIPDSSLPVYSCEEVINIFDNLETSTWVKNSAGSSDSSTTVVAQPHLTVKAAADQTNPDEVPNEADFIVTSDCLNIYKENYVYDGINSVSKLKQAVEKIIALNNADTSAAEAIRPEYKILLTSDITFTAESDFTSVTSPTACSVAINLNSTKTLKIAFIGKEKMQTININSSSIFSSSATVCGIYANENTRLTLNNICVKGAGSRTTANMGTNPGTSEGGVSDTAATLDKKIAVWVDGAEVSGNWNSARVTLKKKVLIKDNECNLKFTKVAGSTDSSAPLVIDSSLTEDSSIGLSFGFASGSHESPATVTSGFSGFSARTGITDPAEVFFADRGFNIILTTGSVSGTSGEVTWIRDGGEGSIIQKIKDDMFFVVTTGIDDEDESINGKLTFDSTENRFYIGYGHDDVYIKPEIRKKRPNANVYDVLDSSPAVSFNLFYVNGDPVPATKTVSGTSVNVWQVTNGQFYIKEPTAESTENVIMPPGKYTLTAAATYDGVEYKASWDISYIKITCELDRPRIKVNAPESERVINLVVTVDDGEIRDVSSDSNTIKSVYASGSKLIQGVIKNSDPDEPSTFNSYTCSSSNSYLSTSNSVITLKNSGVARSYLYVVYPRVSYRSLYCYNEEDDDITRIISVDNTNAFYYVPGIPLKCDFFGETIQELVDKVTEMNNAGQGKGWSDEYTVYLMTDAVATKEELDANAERIDDLDLDIMDFAPAFVMVNAYNDSILNPELNLTLKSYYRLPPNATPYTLNANCTPGAAVGEPVTYSNGNLYQAGVVAVGPNANVTIDFLRLCGGNNSFGAVIDGAKGSDITLCDVIIGAKESAYDYDDTVFDSDDDDFVNNFINYANPVNIEDGDLISIDSDSSQNGRRSSFTIKTSGTTLRNVFCGNYGKIDIGFGTKVQIDGIDFVKNRLDDMLKEPPNSVDSYEPNYALIRLRESLPKGSYIKNTNFYNNRVVSSGFIAVSRSTGDFGDDELNLLLENVNIHDNYLADTSSSNADNYNVYGIYCYNGKDASTADYSRADVVKLTMNNCHFYNNNVSAGSCLGIKKFKAISMNSGTLNISDCTFTELADSTNSTNPDCYAIYMSNGYSRKKTGASVATIFNYENVLNLGGKFYTDGYIFLESPYRETSSNSGVYIGSILNLTESISLPTGSELNAFSGNNYEQPAKYATMNLNSNSTPQFEAKTSTVNGTRILTGTLKSYIKDAASNFLVKMSNSSSTTQLSLNDNGILQKGASSSSTSSSEIPEDFVVAPRATFTGTATLCEDDDDRKSQIFIEGRRITLPDLIACDHEVTQEEWEQYMAYMTNYAPSTQKGEGPNYPVYYMNWYEAIMYCNLRSEAEGLTPVYYRADSSGNEVANGRKVSTWIDSVFSGSNIKQSNGKYYYDSAHSTGNNTKLDYTGEGDSDGGIRFDTNANGYRLPTIAEWEYLARGGNLTDNGQTIYSGSNTLDDVAWTLSNSGSPTPILHEVKTKLPNTLGLYDMSGSVFEMCWDRISTITANTPVTGPLSTQTNHYALGGSYNQEDLHAYITKHNYERSLTRFENRGLRVVRNASPAGQFYETEQTSTSSAAVGTGMVYVPGGVFNSSTTLCADDDDRRSAVFIANRVVPIGSLYACDHEVTQGEWEKYMRNYAALQKSIGTNYPIYSMNWYEAIVYCNLRSEAEGLTPVYYLVNASGNEVTNGRKVSTWIDSELPGSYIKQIDDKYYCDYAHYSGNNSILDYMGEGDSDGGIRFDTNANGYRLPTAAEWEYLARGGNLTDNGQTKYSGSDTLADVGCNNGTGPEEVKRKACNSLGLYDMSGNVFEWCWDWQSTIDTNTPVTGPLTAGISRYGLGGSWDADVSVAAQNHDRSLTRFYNRGLRVVRNAPDYGYVFVEGGTVVGSDDYNQRRADGETYIGAFPAGRTVTLSSFYICDHELTQGEYETYCCYTSSTPSTDYGTGTNYPAYYVSWYDAIVYCNLRSMAENLTPCYALGDETDPTKWDGIKSSNGKYSCSYTSSNSIWDSITCDITASGYRLPTEAEWEYAARGGQETYGTTAFANYFAGATTTNYSANSNSDLDSVGWYKYNICNTGVTGSEGSSGAAGYGTHEVKKKAPNALGLYDMSGNVYEWCWDWKGSISTSETVTDPPGASSGSNRLGRGGSWNGNASNCSVSRRGSNYPYSRYDTLGFRLVRSAE